MPLKVSHTYSTATSTTRAEAILIIALQNALQLASGMCSECPFSFSFSSYHILGQLLGNQALNTFDAFSTFRLTMTLTTQAQKASTLFETQSCEIVRLINHEIQIKVE